MTISSLVKRTTPRARRVTVPCVGVLFAILACSGSLAGQTPAPTQPPNPTMSPITPPNTTTPPNTIPAVVPPTPVVPAPAVPPLTGVQVTDVFRAGHQDGSDKETRNSAGIGDIIVIKVDKLKSLVNHAKCLTLDDLPVPVCQKQELALYLDGREIKGIQPESGAPLPSDQTLQFHLNRNDESDEAWADLLGAPMPFKADFFTRPTGVSVGLKNGYALPTEVEGDDFKLVRIRFVRFLLCLLGTVVLTVLLLIYAKRKDLLRDAVEPPAGGSPPFSLGRFQMAFWFYLVIVSFVFIWAVTGALDIITAQVLALVGIGAGTALGAATLDVGKSAGASSGKFLRDILRDPLTGNTSFHRFQVFIWTLVLGCIFLHSVWSRLSMPEFDGTLIALMGISAGTYLGFKIPETKT